ARSKLGGSSAKCHERGVHLNEPRERICLRKDGAQRRTAHACVFARFLGGFHGTLSALQTTRLWLFSPPRRRSCSRRRAGAGNISRSAPRCHAIRTPRPLPHLS